MIKSKKGFGSINGQNEQADHIDRHSRVAYHLLLVSGAKAGSLKRLLLLCRQRGDGQTILHKAVLNKHLPLVKFIVSDFVHLLTPDDYRCACARESARERARERARDRESKRAREQETRE